MTTKPRVFSHILLVLILLSAGLLCLTPVAARAADQKPIFVPTSAWLVGPASLAVPAGSARIPCVMANQFDNGFTLRVSGGGGKVYALAIDVRQTAFTPGKPYPVKVRLGKNFSETFDGLAYNAATLIVNTQKNDKLYQTLRDNHSLALDIGSQTFEFAILGMDDGFRRLEACYDPQQAQGGQPQEGESASIAPQPMNDSQPPPGLRSFPPPDMPDLKSADNALPAEIEPAAGDATADAEAGAAPQKAVTTLMQPPPTSGGKPRDILAPSGDAAAGADVEKRWRAMKGASLHDVLEIWAKNADTELVWTVGGDFPVKKSVIRQGSMEAAVLELLQQYEDDKARPVGKLYNDPSMNRRVLLIHAEQGT